MLTLYHFPSSVCAAKVRLVLQEKKLPWESRIIEILKGEQFEAWYVALNPNAVVPTLVHDGEAICESAVICEYLDDAFPEPSMRPSDLVDRSVMRIWSSDVDTYMNGICAGITYPATHRHEILKLSPEDLQKFYDGHTEGQTRPSQAIDRNGLSGARCKACRPGLRQVLKQARGAARRNRRLARR